ncbi:hypothetical protein, partial [Nostoc sp. UHCC 0251]|uniref:hypothetical protein n=1 Tax=Nostoc sp. UHCC 0251 TaxID=3110240 RepID=UPI002B20D720
QHLRLDRSRGLKPPQLVNKFFSFGCPVYTLRPSKFRAAAWVTRIYMLCSLGKKRPKISHNQEKNAPRYLTI